MGGLAHERGSVNAKEAIELWYGCDTIEALSQHQVADMLNALVSRVEQLEAAQQSVQADGAFCACVENWSLDVRGNCSNCDLPRRR